VKREAIGKRGAESSASGAASVIGVITLLLVFYIILIPPAAREELLGDGTNATTGGTTRTTERTLLLANPGHLEPVLEQTITHPLPDLYLTEAKEAKILATSNPLRITSNVFSSPAQTFTFNLADPTNTDNVILTFTATEFSDELRIALNGIPIYTETLTTGISTPIQLRKDILQTSNTLTFTVSRPGLAFWRTNKYALTNIQIIGDITDTKRQESLNTFAIEQTEYGNVGRAHLDFIPICEQKNTGTLTITLNGKLVFSAIPACESQNRIDLDKADLLPGKNTALFKAAQGTYRVEQIRIQTIPKQPDRLLQFFTIDKEAADAITAGRHVILDIEFVDDGTLKRATTNVNGRLDSIDQRDARFVRDITTIARIGNNYIDLVPRTSLDIVKLEVRLE